MHREVTALKILGSVTHPSKYYIQDCISVIKTPKLNPLFKQSFILFSPFTLMSLDISRVYLQN
jgi:hypothetical protein